MTDEPTKKELKIVRRVQAANELSQLRSKVYRLEQRADNQANTIIGLLILVTALIFVVTDRKKVSS